jgi:photosystem II stability/assembly factor-like uncharacterized protein
MKHIVITFALLVLAVSPMGATEPWESFGPAGITVSAMSTVPGHPNDIHVVAAGYPAHVYYTSNEGQTWTLRDTIRDRIEALVVHPTQTQTLYAGGEKGHVYRSISGGRIWTRYATLTGNAHIRQLAFKPDEPLVMWAAADIPGSGTDVSLGFFVSTNGGIDWTGTTVQSGQTANSVLLHADPNQDNRLFLGGDVNGAARLFRSDNSGGNWSDISGGLGGATAFSVATNPGDPTILICATDTGLFRSTNSGASWTLRIEAPCYSAVFADRSPYYGYAGSDNLVYRSNDNGETWQAETTDFVGTNTRWLVVNHNLPLELYDGNGAGIFHTTNGGYSWESITDGLAMQTIPFLHFYQFAPTWVFTCPPGNGIMASTDAGVNWDRIPGFPNSGFTTGITVNPRSPDTLLAVTSTDPCLFRTTDRGDSWTGFVVDEQFRARGLMQNPSAPDTVYAWGAVGSGPAAGPRRFAVYRSTNHGRTWTDILTEGTAGCCHGFRFAGAGDSLFAWGEVDDSAVIYLSLNRGGTWFTRDFGLTGARVSDLSPAPFPTGGGFVCATPTGVFRSSNNGGSWVRLGLRNVTAVLSDTSNFDVVLAGTDTGGVYLTSDGGSTWERDTVGLFGRDVTFLERGPDNPAAVYCGTTGAGIFGRGVIGIFASPHRSLPVAGLVRPSIIADHATLHLGAAVGQCVRVDLFSADGRLAAQLADLKHAPATWTWHRPPGLKAGVYLLVTSSLDWTRTSRVVLTGHN